MGDNDRSSGFGYLLIGLAVGAIGAVLLAPRSGEETRELLSEKAQDGMVYAKDTLADLKDRVEANVGEARERVNEAVRAGRVAYQDEITTRQAELESFSS
jgi:gas vesicle protein